jgi:hypothetical protein
VLDASVQAATENYYVTLYGTPDGSGPFGAGTPAEAFSSSLDAAYQSFSTAEQAAFQAYTSSMEGWDMQMMQYFMDEMMGMGGTPPDPDDPARFSKDYHVDVAALGVDLAAAHGAAWVAWVSAEVAGNGKEAGLNDAVGATRLRGLTPWLCFALNVWRDPRALLFVRVFLRPFGLSGPFQKFRQGCLVYPKGDGVFGPVSNAVTSGFGLNDQMGTRYELAKPTT